MEQHKANKTPHQTKHKETETERETERERAGRGSEVDLPDPHMTHHKRFLYKKMFLLDLISFRFSYLFHSSLPLPLLLARYRFQFGKNIIKNCYLNRMQIGLRFNFF